MPGARGARTVAGIWSIELREPAVPTTTSVLCDLHHQLRGSGPPLLFIAGASGDAGHFARTAERLADMFTTVAYDRRGCSRSARLGEGERMSIVAQADDAAALIEQLGLAPAIVFGTSGGGDILLELIARRPDVVRGGIVHEPALLALAAKSEDAFEPLVELAAVDPRGAMEAFVRTVTSHATFESLDPELRERMLASGGHFFAQELAAFRTYVPDAQAIRAAGVPLRVLVSRDGAPPLIHVTAQLAEQLGLELQHVSGHHAPYLQRPEVFAEELRPVLRELS
jgi:pimeloyl-ACP methyl ester carboxylesterase